MSVKWVIENFTDAEDYKGLIQAVKDSGREAFVIGKHNHFDYNSSWVSSGDCVLVQGSIQMVKHLKSKISDTCYPIAYANFENFLCSKYYPYLNKYLFNDKHEFVYLKDLKKERFKYYARFGKEAMMFIRPDSGDKPFTAQLIDLQDFDRFWSNGISSAAQDDDLLLVSTPKMVRGEWRFVCDKWKNIIAYSSYIYQGQKLWIPNAPEGAKMLVQEILEIGYYPDKVFCIDVCEDFDGNYWVLELTSFSSAGLYATDKQKIVERVSEIAEREPNEA
jgi:hypothetical protein